MIARPCIESGCPSLAMPGKPRCRAHELARQRRRNASPKRQAYRASAYRAQPKGGVCWLCGLPGADTRDHVVPVATQMQQWGEVLDHRTRPAHRKCNSSRGDGEVPKSSTGTGAPNPALTQSPFVQVWAPPARAGEDRS